MFYLEVLSEEKWINSQRNNIDISILVKEDGIFSKLLEKKHEHDIQILNYTHIYSPDMESIAYRYHLIFIFVF